MAGDTPTKRYLVRPFWSRVLNDRASLVFILALPISVGVTYPLPFDQRGDIVRSTVGLGAPILVALFAIVVAAFTVFVTLSSKEVRKKLLERYEYLISFFYSVMGIIIVTTVYGMLLFLLSYSRTVTDSAWYYWACVLGCALMAYCFVQVLDTGKATALQAVGVHRLDLRKGEAGRLERIEEE